MSTKNPIVLLLVACALGVSAPLAGQYGSVSIPNLSELPLTLSWDENGIRIVAKTADPRSGNLLKLVPSRYLEQIGNDLIRVTTNYGQAPVIIDLTDYYEGRSRATVDASSGREYSLPKISVEMPKLALADYNEPNSFLVEIRNYTDKVKGSSQTFLFRGLDVFYVNASECAGKSSLENRIILDVEGCEEVKYLVIEGGLLGLADVEEKIPALCNKYNDRYYIPGQTKAFLCIEDCKGEGEKVYQHLEHVRDLITKYNITDYEDAPLSYLGDIILTKKGVGFNVNMQKDNKLFQKSGEFEETDTYKFFPWYEFINLSFAKHRGTHELMITDPYNNSYLYNSKVYFTNVELIQFFTELKDIISERVYKS